MSSSHWHAAHLLRRAAFGPTATDRSRFGDATPAAIVDHLVDYERLPDDVDGRIGRDEYVGVATRGGPFSPNTSIDDARQRWLFRLVHSERQLQEKMALFWHNHFATAYSKIAGALGAVQATKMLALKRGELPGPQGQIELFRQHALGNFRTLLVEVARDPAMLVWLDGRSNTRARPQENFAREIMELFTWGVGHFREEDVYAAARVFTGWNLRNATGGPASDPGTYYEFFYNANQHDTGAKTFTFPVYADGGRTIPARSASTGMQDGIDFITALAGHPETARRLARKLWQFFVSDLEPPPADFVEAAATEYLRSGTEMKPVVRFLLRSPWFSASERWHARYSWPVEFVVRAIREIGWAGLSVDTLRTPLANMGQTLFEPPDVAGWETGPAWFSTSAMLARMNFAAALAANQRFNLARDAGAYRGSPEHLVDFFMERLSPAPFDREPFDALLAYARAGASWTGSDAQVAAKAAGLARLVIGSAEYQFV